ncbi:uncharacterized protein C8A04DRAFT_35162 [Dichotomopilus funicola]|uniref:SH3 domain-containing protein n=1 Tax=Dichotomopilus funicola TaxID=1934379 RepID=A0AAN6V7E8_9PEZI|nr:hypothetical protein C8A04DRAFT_35162 [Dichotomopilus funicola]
MTRPHIIRADTIDLQTHEAPSAQRHHRPAPDDGTLAPHQAETLREVAVEAAEENLRSPGVAWNPEPDDIQDLVISLDPAIGGPRNGAGDTMRSGTQQDALAVAQNGGHAGQEVDDGDIEGDADVDLDDDMMDKISSSPSIEDGGSPRALSGFLPTTILPPPTASPSISDPRSSSPYLESPEYLPLEEANRELRQRAEVAQSPLVISPSCHHYHDGEFEAVATADDDADDDEDDDNDLANKTSSLFDCFDFGDNLFLRDARQDNGAETSWQLPPEHAEYEMGDGFDIQEHEFDDLTVPYDPDELYDNDDDYYNNVNVDDDDDDYFLDLHTSRHVDSGWGGECLQHTEDIDFDFVYALHTFVATVEGQANATKGDTMVLLDDSNSYWWLLSASMLGDQPDKAKNGIRSAMKRRKAKNVQFAAPTYVDYSDFDYSTEEEDAEISVFAQRQQQGQQTQQSQQSASDTNMDDEAARVEPLKPKSQAKAESKRQEANSDADLLTADRGLLGADDAADGKAEGPKKSSDGTVRDSFFKDDTVETKKITLTPNLLRDDTAPRTSGESKEMKQRPSLDKLEKDNVFTKDDKKKSKKEKEKDKKPGGLRGFFSRKDKKSKGEEDDDSFGKRSMDADAPEKDDDEEAQPSPEKLGPQRTPSKLQKQPRGDPSPTRKSKENGGEAKSFWSDGRVNNVANVPPTSMRLVEASPKGSPQTSPREQQIEQETPVKAKPTKPVKAKAAKSRVELDDFDSDEEIIQAPTRDDPASEEATQQQPQPFQNNINEATAEIQPALAPPPSRPAPAAPTETVSPRTVTESPVQESPISSSNPPQLMADHSSQEEDRASPVSTPSPEPVEHEDADTSGHKTATTPSTARSESWDDANLRAFFDSGSDIRDLLMVVYDKNNVDDVGPDHPAAGSLFREQNAKLAEITTRLDDMLGDWLARKQRLRGSV